MSNGHGGHRTPTNPAPASGPGRLSKRTDGGPGQKLMAPTGMPYGDHQALMQQERTAPMSQANSVKPIAVPAAAGAAPAGAPPQLTALDAPSARPGEPITHGVDIGPGGGPEVLNLPPPASAPSQGAMTTMLAGLAAQDRSGAIANLYQSALAAGA